jgi:hypothetical protein
MGIFSTRNSDGASGKSESSSTISKRDMDNLKDRAIKQQIRDGGMFSSKAIRYGKAHDESKAKNN